MSIFPTSLRSLVSSHFSQAVSSGTCLFADSETDTSSEAGIEYRISFAPSLAHKPTSSNTSNKDPFVAPFQPHLFIAEGADTDDDDDEAQRYVLLLNKFSVSPNHSILVTEEFRPQNTPPSRSELYTLYSLLSDQQSGFDLAFFNNGPESGASQPHKHYQLLVLPDGAPTDSLIQRYQPPRKESVFSLPWNVAPYANYIVKIDEHTWRNMSTVADKKDALIKSFMSLFDRAIQNMRKLSYNDYSKTEGVQSKDSSSGENNIMYYAEPAKSNNTSNDIPHRTSALSYNLILTRFYMMLVPRKCEKAVIYKKVSREDESRYDKKPRTLSVSGDLQVNTGTTGASDDNAHEQVSINSLGFVGMVLAKSQSQREYILGAGVRQVLTAVCWENALADDEDEQ